MLTPKVSIIIVNYNGKSHLEKCLKSLFNIDYKNFEVILIDNNSHDGSTEFTSKFFPTVIIEKLNSNNGFAAPSNLGAKIATGEYLLFLNNDTIVNSNFLSELVTKIENDKKIAICQSLLLKPDGKIDSSGDFIDNLGVVYNSKTKCDGMREISSARGASMLIRKEIFERLNGFDEKFFVSFEDVDLGWRAWILGYRVILVPSSIVTHVGGTTIKKIKSEIAFHGFKNQLAMKITNFEPSLAFKNIILFFMKYGLRELRIYFDYVFRGKTELSSTKYENNIAPKPNFRIIISSIIWILKNYSYLRKKQILVNSSRVLSTKKLLQDGIFSDKIQ